MNQEQFKKRQNTLGNTMLGLALLGIVGWAGYACIKGVGAQQNATMKLSSDGPTYNGATFQLPAGSAVTNAGPSGSVTLGGSLISLGTQTTTVSYPGAVIGDRYACGVSSPTAAAATMLALSPTTAVVTAADTVMLGVRNEGTGLLSATNLININCTTKLNP